MSDLPHNSQFPVIHKHAPHLGQRAGNETRFKIKLSLPGKDIKGAWLCRALPSASAIPA